MEGDLVWVEWTNIPLLRPSKKLNNKQISPFPVIKKIGAGAYKIKLPDSFKRTSATFNKALLTPFRPPVFESQKQAPPPDPENIDGHQEWEVKSIKDVK